MICPTRFSTISPTSCNSTPIWCSRIRLAASYPHTPTTDADMSATPIMAANMATKNPALSRESSRARSTKMKTPAIGSVRLFRRSGRSMVKWSTPPSRADDEPFGSLRIGLHVVLTLVGQALPELELHDLAARVERQRVDELDASELVLGQPLPRPLQDLVGIRGRSLARGTTNATRLSPIRSSGTPTTATWAIAGWQEQHAFDLGGVGVEAAHDEHVLLAVGDVEVAVGVDEPDVAGAQPAVAIAAAVAAGSSKYPA